MRLTGVTFSGADDEVAPRDLCALENVFERPLVVEWGILRSVKRAGTPRYPSDDWDASLRATFEERKGTHALHLCGQAARDLMVATPEAWRSFVASVGYSCRRVQINGFDAELAKGLPETLDRVRDEYRPIRIPTIILQTRTHDAFAANEAFARRIGGEILFDPSGGTGAPIVEFQLPASLAVRVGYAGGIGPETVDAVLEKITKLHGAHGWIDMESGVRTADRFDLEKVFQVLNRLQRWVQ